jgi:hypothetical protein
MVCAVMFDVCNFSHMLFAAGWWQETAIRVLSKMAAWRD